MSKSRKIILCPESQSMKLKRLLDTEDAWVRFDLVIIPDETYEESVKQIESTLPEGKRITQYSTENPKDG